VKSLRHPHEMGACRQSKIQFKGGERRLFRAVKVEQRHTYPYVPPCPWTTTILAIGEEPQRGYIKKAGGGGKKGEVSLNSIDKINLGVLVIRVIEWENGCAVGPLLTLKSCASETGTESAA